MSSKWNMMFTYQTEYPADSVEWCPFEPYQEYFASGNYLLLENSNPSDVQERIGSISFMKVEENNLVLVQKVECFGILDMKWCQVLVQGNMLLGAVTAKGDVQIYCLKEGRLEFFCGVNLRSDEKGDYMTLATNWSADGEELCVTDNKGNAGVLKLTGDRLEILDKWKGHDLEAWTVAFDAEDSNILYTGGDDAKLKMWDRRTGTQPKATSKFHDSGVTIIQPYAQLGNTLLVGSFDESLNFFDPRYFKSPKNQVRCSGGLWRTKCRDKYALTANIYGGFQIIDLCSAKVLADYKDHVSLAYGADWSFMKGEKLKEIFKVSSSSYLVGTCSFCDKKLDISIWDSDDS